MPLDSKAPITQYPCLIGLPITACTSFISNPGPISVVCFLMTHIVTSIARARSIVRWSPGWTTCFMSFYHALSHPLTLLITCPSLSRPQLLFSPFPQIIVVLVNRSQRRIARGQLTTHSILVYLHGKCGRLLPRFVISGNPPPC